ncbi:cupin domain-containing protein [Lichenicola sp.]|uniref:cupin domain-containing protein n=1 Tax=Lichenicola sp. TaxID=2804529 RepID=UPI003AFF88BE
MKRLVAMLALLGAGVAGSGAAVARDPMPQVAYWDNWTDHAGVSHLTRCTLHGFSLHSVARPAAPEWQDRQATPASAILTNVEPPGWVGQWHENPKVQWIMPIAGSWFVQAMDGSDVTVGPGDVIVGEDQGTKPDAAGHKGHLARNPGPGPVSLMIVQMAGMPPTAGPCRFE